MRKYIFNISILLLISLLLTACSTVPYSGRSQLLFTSIAEENQMGNQAWQGILSKERVTYNKNYIAAVNRIGSKIAAVAEQPEFEWEFKVFESEQPNAFCLPGGKVAVYSGLFQFSANDAELASVVGHEIGHAIARHGGERVSHNMLVEIGGQILGGVVDPTINQEWQLAYGLLTNVGAVLPYSRDHEYEADYIGLILMAKAGYDPQAALNFWKKFGEVSKTSRVGEFFSTHPMGDKRLKRMRDHLPAAMKFYENAKQRVGLGAIYR